MSKVVLIFLSLFCRSGEKNNAEVEKQRNNIISTANRLVQRMKRDWMHYGRRPSGLCGAAILVAARLNEVHCSIKDIIKVVKVCETTIRKRLCEFSETPTSNLTLDEFMTIDLEGEEDPPCFKASKRKQKLSQLENEQQMEEIQTKISHLQKLIEIDLEKSRKKLRTPLSNYLKTDSPDGKSDDSVVEQFIIKDTVKTIENVLNEDSNYDEYIETIKSLRPTAASLGITDVITNYQTDIEETKETEENNELDLTGIDDNELDGYLLTADEIDAKTNVWTRVHKDYLEEMRIKEELKAKEEEERKRKEAAGEVQPKKKRKTRKKMQIQANSASEAIEKMLQEKKISTKINYDVLKNLNPTFGQSTSTFKAPEPVVSETVVNTFEQKRSLKRLPSLKNSSSSSLVNLKTSLLSRLKMKSLESDLHTKEDDDLNEEQMVVQNKETISRSAKNVTAAAQPKETSTANEDVEEDEDEDEDEDEYEEETEKVKGTQLSIQQLLVLESGDNDIDNDNNYFDYEDEDYE